MSNPNSTTTATAVAAVAPPKRFFKSKAEWAEARSKELRQRAYDLTYQSSGGSTSRARSKYQGIEFIRSEADRFSKMAAYYRSKHL